MLDAQTLHGFVQSCLQRKFDAPVKTPPMHLEWWDLCCNGDRQVAIAAPRRHAKSTAITFSYVLAALMFREHQFVIICSDTETQSSLFLGDIKQELLENEDLISLFGIKKFIKLSETDIIVEMNDGHKFRVMAKGAEQKLRGVKWDGKRPDLIVCDDMENDEAVMNADRREKFRRWFYGALLQCRSGRGKIIIVGTILHMDSLLERLMAPQNGAKLITEDLKSYPEETRFKARWKSVKYRAHNEDFSKILWKEQWSKEQLQAERQGYLEQGLSDVYSREFLNYPIDESVAYFRRDDFIAMNDNDKEQTELTYYTAADFAISTKERSDYTVMATVGMNSSNTLFVVDIQRARLDGKEIIDMMFDVHNKYHPDLFIVESGAIEKALGPFLWKEMELRNKYLNLYPQTPTKDKVSRARSLQARLRAGNIKFDKSKSWYPTLEDEMARFPRDRHDDQVDALSWIGLVLDKLIDSPSSLKQEEREEEYDNDNDFYEQGRNLTTGY